MRVFKSPFQNLCGHIHMSYFHRSSGGVPEMAALDSLLKISSRFASSVLMAIFSVCFAPTSSRGFVVAHQMLLSFHQDRFSRFLNRVSSVCNFFNCRNLLSALSWQFFSIELANFSIELADSFFLSPDDAVNRMVKHVYY